MNKVVQRPPTPMVDVFEWLESNNPFSLRALGLAPYVRIEDYEEDGTYVLRAELPGIDPATDVELKCEAGMLTISGERHEETKDKNRREFHYGSFRRTVPLPVGTQPDDVTASYTHGVLEVRVPIKPKDAPSSVTIPVTLAE